jgi:amino acid transporter
MLGMRGDTDSTELPRKVEVTQDGLDETPQDIQLHRGLKARHITMIGMLLDSFQKLADIQTDLPFSLAIGGAIGTGLIIGTGSALAKAGVS